MKLFLILIIFIQFFLNQSFALDTTSIKYFPMKVGNSYTYKYTYNYSEIGYDSTFVGFYKSEIVKDSIFNGKRYFYCINFPFKYDVQTYWLRTDSLTGSLYRYNPVDYCSQYYFKEDLVDTLGAELGGIVRDCHSLSYVYVDFINVDTLFNELYLKKNFHSHNSGMYFNIIIDKTYSMNIGLSKYKYRSGLGTPIITKTYELTGCIIDNIKYGDTSTVGIHNNSFVNSVNYILNQNYPNPFNPKTTIGYEINSSREVKLTIYNTLGMVVSELVDQKQNPGKYEIDFNANDLGSGIYFYSLYLDKIKVDTKKLILLK